MPKSPVSIRPTQILRSLSLVTAMAMLVTVGAVACANQDRPRGAGGGDGAGPTTSDPRIDALDIDIRRSIADSRDRVFPALVNIDTVFLDYSAGKETKRRSGGSGTIISAEGHVLTNAHVTDQGVRFWCTLADKRRIPATMVGEDPWTDLAVLKLDPKALRESGGGELPVAGFGDSDRLTIGEYVLAMGSPFSLSRTVTLGVVSNTERVFTSGSGGDLDEMQLNFDQRTGTFTNWVQHDALINPGNSGGPLVNLAGEVVGVNTRGGAGMAFATPSNQARAVAKEIIRSGEVVRSTLGVTFRHIEATGLKEGVLVDSVEAEGAAAAAGLRPGDVVTKMDGKALTVRFAEEVPALLAQIAEMPVGRSIRLDYQRDLGKGETGTAVAVTTKLLRDQGKQEALRLWGLTVQEITERAQQRMRLPSRRGAIVSGLARGGTAGTAEPSLSWGDVIIGVDGRSTETLADVVAAYERIASLDKDKRPEWVMIEFEREGKSFLTLIRPAPAESPDPPVELPKAWIGVATQPVIRTLAKQMGDEGRTGFRVTRVYTGTEAAKAGLQVGDLIVSLNGDPIRPTTQQDSGLFNRQVRRLSIGGEATLGVVREGESREIALSLERTRLEPGEAPRAQNTDFELSVRDITFFDRQDRRWDDSVTGVIVANVEQAGWAGLGGVRPGDLIQRIGGFEIRDVASFRTAMAQIEKAQPERIVFVVFRGFRTYFRFVEPDWKPGTSDKAVDDLNG
ncbi:MAG: PDZ domain-containing protein [Phycisphaeraceae bacterium]|nr:PDZ domain-containing protein [Phycisphaeraceae bacterium]